LQQQKALLIINKEFLAIKKGAQIVDFRASKREI
jgi:hypothetical protein